LNAAGITSGSSGTPQKPARHKITQNPKPAAKRQSAAKPRSREAAICHLCPKTFKLKKKANLIPYQFQGIMKLSKMEKFISILIGDHV
jgi:hypothetical protein